MKTNCNRRPLADALAVDDGQTIFSRLLRVEQQGITYMRVSAPECNAELKP
jgi:hypothetical protein